MTGIINPLKEFNEFTVRYYFTIYYLCEVKTI